MVHHNKYHNVITNTVQFYIVDVQWLNSISPETFFKEYLHTYMCIYVKIFIYVCIKQCLKMYT